MAPICCQLVDGVPCCERFSWKQHDAMRRYMAEVFMTGSDRKLPSGSGCDARLQVQLALSEGGASPKWWKLELTVNPTPEVRF